MKLLGLDEVKSKFNTFFSEAKKEMFKAEVLQDYSATDQGESLKAWLKGDKARSIEIGKVEPFVGYKQWVDRCVDSPAKISRVHIAEEPYTPYLEWEIEVAYKGLIKSGAEAVCVVPAIKVQHLEIPSGDFWIFDNERAVEWKYQGLHGKTVGGQVYEKGEDISKFLQLKMELMKVAVPVE